jgi:hypothetical protein
MTPTPEKIMGLEKNQIFVFGSNLAGWHGKGAALAARLNFGAKNGQGVGLMGQSYAIPTKDEWLQVLSLSEIKWRIESFVGYAWCVPKLEFLVTQIGCGLAGYRALEIAPLFGDNLPENIRLPQSFMDVLKIK